MENLIEKNEIIEKIKLKGLDPNNFCVVPFSTIILEPDGTVGVCRQKGTEFVIGSLKHKRIDEIWNDYCVRLWRSEFLTGNSTICRKDIDHKKCNLCPENNKLLNVIQFNEIQSQKILKLTANLNGKCNLACKMCDVYVMPNGFYNEDNFWNPARRDIFPFLKEVDMLSGEPFIQKDTYKLIEEICAVNSDCLWNFTTNAYWDFGKKIRETLDQVKIKTMTVSIDGVTQETYREIRGGELSKVKRTLEGLISYRNNQNEERKFPIYINYLVQKDNWRELPAYFEFIRKLDVKSFPTFLYSPSNLSLLNFSENEIVEVLHFWFSELCPNSIARSRRVIIPLLEKISNINKAHFLLEYRKKISDI